jgi:hypothetical protein
MEWGSCETELEQFTMNVWCTPEVICTAHRADEIAQLGRDSLKSRAMPADDCLSAENCNRAKDGREPTIEPNKQEAIGIADVLSL